MLFLPKSPKIFDRFDELASLIKQSGGVLPRINNGTKDISALAKQARALELKADGVYQTLIHEADSLFITPIDQDDIHVLAKNLDDISDLIEDVVASFSMYKIKKGTKEFTTIAKTINETTENVSILVHYLRNGSKHIRQMKELIAEIRALENTGDDLTRKAVASLFSDTRNTIAIMQWKDIYEEMENVLDECETTSNIVDEIIIKNF